MKIFFLTLVLVLTASAKKPLPAPTEDQMRSAYDACTRQMSALAKNPASLRVDSIDRAWFAHDSSRLGEFIDMLVVFDGQNVYGATVRGTARCSMWLRGADVYGNRVSVTTMDVDAVALGAVPKGMVPGPTPEKSRTPADR